MKHGVSEKGFTAMTIDIRGINKKPQASKQTHTHTIPMTSENVQLGVTGTTTTDLRRKRKSGELVPSSLSVNEHHSYIYTYMYEAL